MRLNTKNINHNKTCILLQSSKQIVVAMPTANYLAIIHKKETDLCKKTHDLENSEIENKEAESTNELSELRPSSKLFWRDCERSTSSSGTSPRRYKSVGKNKSLQASDHRKQR